MSRPGLVLLVIACLAPWACQSARLDEVDGGPGDGGADADADVDADVDEAGPIDPCEAILCGEGQTCQSGRCLTIDACLEVTCPNPGEVCDPRDGACHAGAADDDSDGFSLSEGDCDDSAPTIHPGAVELCDGADQDCDLEVDEGFVDGDGDGFDTCGFGDPTQADCDDGDPSRRPGATEQCDGVDQDCDGDIDEDIATRPCETDCASGLERCEGGGWACSAPATCECTPAGAVDTEVCGRCGTRSRSCSETLRWGDWSECEGQGECAAGAAEEGPCGNCDEGTRSRSCDTSCAWRPWTDCSLGGESGQCLGCEADLGAPSDSLYLGSGWHGRETYLGQTARWIDGTQQGTLFLGVEPSATTLTFTWLGNNLHEDCSSAGGHYQATIHVDGVMAGVADVIVDGAFHSRSVSIPWGTAADGFLEVVITSSDRVQPALCTSSTDTRWLSLYIALVTAC